MNPIPLSAPDGTVYAYACGTCHRVCGGSQFVLYHEPRPQPVAELTVAALRVASSCCTCTNCGMPTPLDHRRECPPCRAESDRRWHWRGFCDAWLNIGRAVNGIEPERDDDGE